MIGALFSKLKGSTKRQGKKVLILPSNIELMVEGDMTILEAAMASGVSYPYSCTVGTCGSCKTRLVEGKVSALHDFAYTLDKQELAAGYILACQAIPKTDLIVEAPNVIEREIIEPEKFDGSILHVERLTHDIVRVAVELDRPMRYEAGQYANLKPDFLDAPRSFSFVDAPEAEGCSRVSFFIRRVPGGAFTDWLFGQDRVGQRLEVEGPLGAFGLHKGQRTLLLVAGGSGLGPIKAILEQAISERDRRNAILFFGVRTQADFYCLDELKEMQKRWGGRFDIVSVLSEEVPGEGSEHQSGLVTDYVNIGTVRHGLDECQAYLCGPPVMVDAAIATLKEQGVSGDQIFFDKFLDQSHTPSS